MPAQHPVQFSCPISGARHGSEDRFDEQADRSGAPGPEIVLQVLNVNSLSDLRLCDHHFPCGPVPPAGQPSMTAL